MKRCFYCWRCAKRRLFVYVMDAEGGNWFGVACEHALWSEQQHRAEKKATDAT